MPSQVLTKRRVKRRQQRLRLVSKNAKRKVRSVRKHRKTAKKVMRGGADIKSDIFLEGKSDTPVIKLNISKNMFGPNYTIKIEIDLDLYKDDVRDLLKNLFDVEGKGGIEYAGDKNEKEMRRVMFLLGLADIPEREGAKKWAIDTAMNVDNTLIPREYKHTQVVKDKITKQDTSTNKKCFMKITTDNLKWGLKFTVKNYSRISPEECSSYTRKKRECYGEIYYGTCMGNMDTVNKTVPVFYPKLIPEATSEGGIDLINWGWYNRNPQFPFGVWKKSINENTFTFETKLDIKAFIEEFKKPKILKTDGTLVVAPAPTSPSSDTSSTVDVAAPAVNVAPAVDVAAAPADGAPAVDGAPPIDDV